MEIRKKGNLWFLVIIYLFFYSCKQNQENSQTSLKLDDKEQNEKIKLSNKVIITGITDDPKAFKYLNFLNYSYFFGTNHKDIKQKVFNDSLLLVMRSINQPQLIEFMSFGNNLYNTRIFISPGDSINLSINNGKIQFTGKNATQYNFFIQLDSTNNEWAKNKYKGDIKEYKKQCQSIYKRRIQFFKEYIKRNKVSDDFITIVKSELKFEYLYNLIAPRSIVLDNNLNINSEQNLISTIAKDYNVEKDGLFDLENYFDYTSIQDFNRLKLINNDYFKRSLTIFIRNYFVKSDYLDYSRKKFIAEKEFIQKSFEGELEYYAIARMIRDYSTKGFGYSIGNNELIKNTINEYYPIFSKKPSYKSKMDEIKESLDNFNFKLSNDALNSKLINPMNDTITLRDVFNSSSNKIKVIDFWATWCPPCIYEIKKAKEFKNKLAFKDDVEWIYISVDKDYKTWLKKSYELQEFLNTKNQYLILGGQNSSLAKSLKVSGIPRYVVFDKQEKIVLDYAPRPSDSIIFKKIIDKINLENE